MNADPLHAVVADVVFDGTKRHEHSAVLIENGKVRRVIPSAEIAPGTRIRRLPRGAWLAPGFIDLQVNGGGDVLFNDAPSAETISVLARAHRKFGTTGFLPTLITDTREKMQAAICAAQRAMRIEPSVLGLHLEGPFLSREKAGVHDTRLLRAPSAEDAELLTAARPGTLLVTLAPERVPSGFVAGLASAGVCVSLGHSMATYAQTRAAISEGLTGFTHLFNAMRSMEAREPGPIGAALETSTCSLGLIVDGKHVHPAMLLLGLRGASQPMLVTDAMPPVGGIRAGFMLYGEEIALREGCCVRQDGTLAGAYLDMAGAVRNCVRLLGLSLEDALRFASTNPARYIRRAADLGMLASGARADMVAIDPERIEVLDTWVAGLSEGDQ